MPKKTIPVKYAGWTYRTADKADRAGMDFNSTWLRNRQDILLKNAREAGWRKPERALDLELDPERFNARLKEIDSPLTIGGRDSSGYASFRGLPYTMVPSYERGYRRFPWGVLGDSAVHETAHGLGRGKPQEKVIQNRKIRPVSGTVDPYLDSATEIYSRLQEFRNDRKVDPLKTITKDDIDTWKKDTKSLDYDLLNRYSDEDLLFLFNDVAQKGAVVPANIAALGGKIDRNNMAIGLLKRPHRFDGLSEPTGQKQERHDYVVKGQDYSFWQPEDVQSIIDWGVTNPDAFFGEEGRETRDRLTSAGMGDQVIGGVWDTVYDNATPTQRALLQTNYGDQFKSSARRQQEMEQGVRDAINTKGVATALGTLAVPGTAIGLTELGVAAAAAPQTFASLTVPLLGGSAIDQGIKAYSPYNNFGEAVYAIPTPVNRAIQRWGSPAVQDFTKMAYDFANPGWWIGPEKYVQAGREADRLGQKLADKVWGYDRANAFRNYSDAELENAISSNIHDSDWAMAFQERARRSAGDAPYREIEEASHDAAARRVSHLVDEAGAASPIDLSTEEIIHSNPDIQALVDDLGVGLNDITVSARPNGLTAQEEDMAEEAARAEVSPEVWERFHRLRRSRRGARRTPSEPQPEFDWDAIEAAGQQVSHAAHPDASTVPLTRDLSFDDFNLDELTTIRSRAMTEGNVDFSALDDAFHRQLQTESDALISNINNASPRSVISNLQTFDDQFAHLRSAGHNDPNFSPTYFKDQYEIALKNAIDNYIPGVQFGNEMRLSTLSADKLREVEEALHDPNFVGAVGRFVNPDRLMRRIDAYHRSGIDPIDAFMNAFDSRDVAALSSIDRSLIPASVESGAINKIEKEFADSLVRGDNSVYDFLKAYDQYRADQIAARLIKEGRITDKIYASLYPEFGSKGVDELAFRAFNDIYANDRSAGSVESLIRHFGRKPDGTSRSFAELRELVKNGGEGLSASEKDLLNDIVNRAYDSRKIDISDLDYNELIPMVALADRVGVSAREMARIFSSPRSDEYIAFAKKLRGMGVNKLPTDVNHLSWFARDNALQDSARYRDQLYEINDKIAELQRMISDGRVEAGVGKEQLANLAKTKLSLETEIGKIESPGMQRAALQEQILSKAIPREVAMAEHNRSVDSYRVGLTGALSSDAGYGLAPWQVTVEPVDIKPWHGWEESTMRRGNSAQLDRAGLDSRGKLRFYNPSSATAKFSPDYFTSADYDVLDKLGSRPFSDYTPEELEVLDKYINIYNALNVTDVKSVTKAIDKVNKANTALGIRTIDAPTADNILTSSESGFDSSENRRRIMTILSQRRRLMYGDKGFSAYMTRTPTITVKHNLGGPLLRPYPELFSDGGSIHIKPSHRGRLTELKKRTGKSEAELYNDGNPAHKKMVVFARNSRKWKHDDGGFMDQFSGYDPAMILAAISKVRNSR